MKLKRIARSDNHSRLGRRVKWNQQRRNQGRCDAMLTKITGNKTQQKYCMLLCFALLCFQVAAQRSEGGRARLHPRAVHSPGFPLWFCVTAARCDWPSPLNMLFPAGNAFEAAEAMRMGQRLLDSGLFHSYFGFISCLQCRNQTCFFVLSFSKVEAHHGGFKAWLR